MKKLAVLGHPIGHTLSPAMHNASIASLGLAEEYVYGKLDVPPAELMLAWTSCRQKAMPV
jgi:shikimate dehydrogenase